MRNFFTSFVVAGAVLASGSAFGQDCGRMMSCPQVPCEERPCKPERTCSNEAVDIVYVMDKSGSMGGLERDVTGAYNSFVDEHKKIKNKKIKISTVFFDHTYESIFVNEDLANAKLREGQYRVSGSTALLDAFGLAITTEDRRLENLPAEARPCKVIFVVATDGEENSSIEYTASKIQTLVSARQERGWEFLFFGANIDAFAAGGSYGIRKENIQQFDSTSEGIQLMAPKAAARSKALIGD